MSSSVNTNPFENPYDAASAEVSTRGGSGSNPFDLEQEEQAGGISEEVVGVGSGTMPGSESKMKQEDSRLEGEPNSKEGSLEKPGKIISFDSVAKKLLDENFVLTALELHTELMESGRDLRRLRDFFTNPANFETSFVMDKAGTPGDLGRLQLLSARTSSVQTFDSLDFTRYSDDVEREVGDKLAVSEFELRKAKETIRTLREQLTYASEKGVGVEVSGGEMLVSPSTEVAGGNTHPLLPHESKAINFLLNEYLLQNDYRMTSVTFSEEVANQDFEDWDEVGLNVPRPADLTTLYRNYSHANPGQKSRQDFTCGVNMDEELNSLVPDPDLLNRLNEENTQLMSRNQDLNGEIQRLISEIELLHKYERLFTLHRLLL